MGGGRPFGNGTRGSGPPFPHKKRLAGRLPRCDQALRVPPGLDCRGFGRRKSCAERVLLDTVGRLAAERVFNEKHVRGPFELFDERLGVDTITRGRFVGPNGAIDSRVRRCRRQAANDAFLPRWSAAEGKFL